MAKRADTADYLIKECERLSQPSTRTTMNELAKLQHDAVHYLLSLGTEFDTIRQKVEELQFQYGRPPIWRLTNTGQLRDQPIVPSSWSAAGHSVAEARLSEYLSGILTELKNLLVIAKARKKSTASANRPKDPERLKRWRAIRMAHAKCGGKRNYIKSVCRDLQAAKIEMPRRWIDGWKGQGLRVEICDWLVAYQDPTARPGIQKFISKVCKARVNAGAT